MNRVRSRLLVVFALASVLVLGGLAGVSALVIDIEFAERDARGDADHQITLQRALWRMDAWLGPLVVMESSRGVQDYVESARRELSSSFQRAHFEIRETDLAGTEEDLAIGGGDLGGASHRTYSILDWTSYSELSQALGGAETANRRLLANPQVAYGSSVSVTEIDDISDYNANINERALRANAFNNGANFRSPLYSAHTVGQLVPLWIPREDAPAELVFARRVSHASRGVLVQGFVADWERVKEALLGEVSDLLPDAELEPILLESDLELFSEYGLATIPASLVAERRPPIGGLSSAARATLIIAWAAAVIALIAAGMTLRSSLIYGEKRHRFASSVTHELRTPLTTFRMYSEMLSKGMIPEDRRAEYLETLQEESSRLSHLVENVLAYAQLEEGRAAGRIEKVELTELMRRIVPALERRVKSDGAGLVIRTNDADASAAVSTDVEAVGQILFNLVDNAVKYGRTAMGCEVIVDVKLARSRLEVTVADRGPGVPPAVRNAVFRPFDRGALDAADPNPGVGLGLALCRGIARDLGGELALETPEVGATFRLTLPV